ncbi:MAG: hypothetical protein COV29_01400 [Candidatus Yanofskybacteria bacterium CG10_big_fil_rev_8_21_14_0_10_36_16]|uniref:Amidinotransferase n=1 Tax=Candidatus Yanofskybacteria bacterium CG10_big_fil_rev_8_21_14_0_10_36_16 TaxID=1975096 RepID=A0A2J0Q9Y6_9BACT|nr:MAG: hypothetical protein COV29_01400 [Candidatus Yanofskybacteria bacterium CG10_big_fil_rev_8_21_14_0_10_36_16]
MLVLMCRPKYFDVTYRSQTNIAMNPARRPQKNIAYAQWAKLREEYIRNGINVLLIDPREHLVDMAFAANSCLPLPNGHVILSNFVHKERLGEKHFYNEYFSDMYGHGNVHELSHKAHFEGQGDALFVDERTLFITYGLRTNYRAVKEIRYLLQQMNTGIEVVDLPLRNLEDHKENEFRFYHGDTCLMHFRQKGFFLVYPGAFQIEALQKIRKKDAIVKLTKNCALQFAANSLVHNNTVFMPNIDEGQETYKDPDSLDGGDLKILIRRMGYKISEHNMSEFLKSGGAVKCLTLELFSR